MSSSTGSVDAAAGVVDPDVDVAERVDRAIAQALDVGPPGDVGRDHDRAVAGAGGGLPQLGLAPAASATRWPAAPSCAGSVAPMPPLAPVMTMCFIGIARL